MASSASDRRISDGLEHLRLADKCMKTSLFKWKPDYDGAASEYTKAAVSFKNAKAYEQATNCYKKASLAQKQSGSEFHAAKSLESAALICKEAGELDEVVELMEKACQLYLENGTPDTAALSLDRGAKMLQTELPEKAIQLYQAACDVTDAENRPRQCGESIGKAARLLIRLKRFDEAVEALTREIEYYKQVENHGIIHKLVIAVCLVHLHRVDYVAADQYFQKSLCNFGFGDSEECYAVQEVLDAYDQGDQESLSVITKKPVFTYLENDFVKLARDLRVPGGKKSTTNTQQGATPSTPEDDDDDDEYASGLR